MREIEWPSKPSKKDFWYFWFRFWGIVVLLFFSVLLYAIFFAKDEPFPVSPNQKIVSVMEQNFYRYDSVFYRPVAKVLSQIPYEKDMRYWFYSSPGVGIHELEGRYGNLNDTFPWVASELKKIKIKFNLLYSIYIDDGNLSIEPLDCILYNNNQRSVYLKYSTWSDFELLQVYKNYRIYDTGKTVSNSYTGGWLKRIEKNWYIVSFDSVLVTTEEYLDSVRVERKRRRQQQDTLVVYEH